MGSPLDPESNAPLLTPPKNLKGFIQQGRRWPQSFGIVEGDHD